jgi:hypothetical protein
VNVHECDTQLKVPYYTIFTSDPEEPTLLSYCRWELSFTTDALILIIQCSDIESYWQMISVLQPIGDRLERIATDRAKIRVCPPEGKGCAFEIQVNEISTHWDSPWLKF